jgi:hypothetical protein
MGLRAPDARRPPRLLDLLFERLTNRVDCGHPVLLHDALVLLIDQSDLRTEIAMRMPYWISLQTNRSRSITSTAGPPDHAF